MNPDDILIDVAKVRDYLLSASHPVGRFKASFFFRLGYTAESWEVLERDLRQLIVSGTREAPVDGPYGVKHVVSGMVVGPNGVLAPVTSVWIVLHGETTLRFITAYPGALR